MTGQQLREARKLKGWNQQQAAQRLGVSQTYLSLLEKGKRRAPEKLAVKVVRVYGLSEALLPVTSAADQSPVADEGKLASELAALGYPGLSHLKSVGKKKNPAELLLSALGNDNLDSRLVEALPWVVLKFPNLNWHCSPRRPSYATCKTDLGMLPMWRAGWPNCAGNAKRPRYWPRKNQGWSGLAWRAKTLSAMNP